MKNIKYKLLSIDLDGTLLNKYKNISKADIEALKTYNHNGGYIFINTGKNLKQTIKIVNHLNKYLEHPIRYFSCLNGNIIFDLVKKQIIHETIINHNDIAAIIQIVKKHHVNYAYYANIKQQIKLIANYYNNSLKNINIYKLNIIGLFSNLNNNETLINQLNQLNNIEVLRTNNHLFEIVRKDANKGNSLKFICELLKININDVASIGDSNNDASMFKLNNNGFMVSQKSHNRNLKDIVKADLDLKNDKVAYVINHYVLND